MTDHGILTETHAALADAYAAREEGDCAAALTWFAEKLRSTQPAPEG